MYCQRSPRQNQRAWGWVIKDLKNILNYFDENWCLYRDGKKYGFNWGIDNYGNFINKLDAKSPEKMSALIHKLINELAPQYCSHDDPSWCTEKCKKMNKKVVSKKCTK